MSNKYYDEEWKKIQDNLSSVLQIEPLPADRKEQRKLLATLYIRYILIANKLSNVVNQMIQPQKRILIKKLLEATLGRILELKFDLVEADLNEWTHCGDILEILNLNPLQTELKVPECFLEERKDELIYRKNLIDSVLSKLGFLDKSGAKAKMTEQQAVLIIQVHERSRQGRLRAQFMKEIHNMKEKVKPPVVEPKGEDLNINLCAAIKIQKIWRGYVTRRATRRKKLQEMLLIGMIPPPQAKNEDIEKDHENLARRKKLQEQRQQEHDKSVATFRNALEKRQKGVMLEQLSDQVRGWLHEYRKETGKIPEYTGSERTGSRMLMSRQGTESELSKSTQISSKDSKGKKEKSSKSKEKQSLEEEEQTTSKAIISTFLPTLNAGKEEYDEIWRNKEESSNLYQKSYIEFIQHDQYNELENELRKIVDEMMRAELLLLQDAMDKDRGHKLRRKSSKKAKRGSKKSKKKKEKDLTPDRTTESLFEELVANGIIKRCSEATLKGFIGESSYHHPVSYNSGKDPQISLGDVRQLLTEYCVIPMLTSHLHLSTPHIKSILLAGPQGSGKDFLVYAICNEAGATLFDLTPANIVGKYPGKSGLIMLMHLVMKVARLLQPSIIYMDNAERPFMKKIPKTDKTDPRRLKKDLPKLIKNMSPEDRVMLIGVSNCPWDSDQKLLQQVYQKFIVIPRPNYSSRYCLWQFLLSKYTAISWQFDTSVMSKISDGYTVGSIVESVDEVMTVKRMLQLRVKPLSPLELVNALSKRIPVYKEEEEAMALWWSKSPMYKKRIKAIETLADEIAEMQAKQANAKKKK